MPSPRCPDPAKLHTAVELQTNAIAMPRFHDAQTVAVGALELLITKGIAFEAASVTIRLGSAAQGFSYPNR